MLKDKVVLITGGTGGIGRRIAVGLAKQGATVAVTGRDHDRGRAAVAEIVRESGNESVDLLLGDLSSQREVAGIAQEFQARYDRLDVLVNNVGGLYGKRWETVDGIEGTLAVNHLCPFLLTHLLLPLLEASAPARVININSEGHRAAKTVNFEDMAAQRWKRGFEAYSRSKLANLLFTYELASRLADAGVTVNALHPGMVDTQLVQRFLSEKLPLPPGYLSERIIALARAVIRRIYKFDSPDAAAKCPIYLASSDEVATVSGKYFDSDGKMIDSSPASYDRELSRRIWKESAQLVSLGSDS